MRHRVHAQQIDKSPWRLGKNQERNRFLKRQQTRAERREAKMDPESAPQRRAYDGYD